VPAPLPTLPPAFRVSDHDVHPGGRSMIDILDEDHVQLVALCEQLAHSQLGGGTAPGGAVTVAGGAVTVAGGAVTVAGGAVTVAGSAVTVAGGATAPGRLAGEAAPGRLAGVLVAMLSRHLAVEEQYLYPTIKATVADGPALAATELAASGTLLATLHRLHTTAPTEPAFSETVDRLAAQVRRHAAHASRDVFPRLSRSCTAGELIRLGNRVEIAHEAAPTRPHPAKPTTPPANKVVDPCIGAVDKIRDVLNRRTTWPEDL
jgi:Hemerythrin HHE cation binding domain